MTARGAWVAVRRHFTELGIDPERDEFTAVGIGDMSGDVFGNGMLLSDRLRLVAAFDHRHIFLDPDPDPKTSLAERARLSALPGSSWADYDSALISPGGGVYPRSGRSVAVSTQARAALGIDAEVLSADELVQAILRAPVDLLWNGGIGTYVRASHETDADVADRGNDRVRVTADQLRCRVIGEGGNLGLSQEARIEYSLAGGSRERRLHRQCGRREHLRPGGQPQDPAAFGGEGRTHRPRGAQPDPPGLCRRGRAQRPARQ